MRQTCAEIAVAHPDQGLQQHRLPALPLARALIRPQDRVRAGSARGDFARAEPELPVLASWRCPSRRAVSKPSRPAILTSMRIRQKFCFRSRSKAYSPRRR